MLSSGLTFYSENAVVTRALLHRRWIQVPAHHSFVNLTWTVMAADLDFRKLKRGQLCNHFRPTGHLTTKVGLLECLRDYVAPQGTGAESPSDDPSEAAVEAARFFP